MVTPKDPALERRKVRLALRAFRKDAGLNQPDVAEALSWSPSKVIRIEGGSVGVSVTDLRALLDLYNVSDVRLRLDLEEATRASRRPPWWSPYRDVVSAEFGVYLGFEGSADALYAYHPTFVPGLLQTEDYARALLKSRYTGARLKDAVELRMERQERLVRGQEGPELNFLVDEAALRRWIGGPDVMRRQVEHVKTVAGQPRVTVGVVPFSLGVHPVLRKGCIALTFTDGDDVLFMENSSGALTVRNDQSAVDDYLTDFHKSADSSLFDDRMKALADEIIGHLPNGRAGGPAGPSDSLS
ncbi:helix-turn-helix domain-containing protein [Streptomyces poonensis]|uniref:Transcriptional regulator n=1 Tax=Streptomyces poonensis TaxID=68255 RepID=A0A918PAN0_9ACTN|nr:helix-turn-helix transcriptional regulator [Streptomyces poonensis]GGY94971.1 transcriptional regulator [Streptomyces poonensis]GLJ88755.1 transcriptional regulator [Streptomyces poonensis]